MYYFLIKSLAAGMGVALLAGPLGCFIVWRKMAYFGETLAHSVLLGIALAILLSVQAYLGIFVVCFSLGVLLVFLQKQHLISTDTLLGILAHGALSLGVIVLALGNIRFDPMAILFGEILAVSNEDLLWIYLGSFGSLALLVVFWKQLLAITVHEELAYVEGIPVTRVRLVLMLLLAFSIAIAMKIVGVLLITSMLIIPAAVARRFSKSPEQMACLATLIGCVAVGIGFCGSLFLNIPMGPSIVVSALMLFILSFIFPAAEG